MPEAFTISIPQGNPRFKCNSGRELTKAVDRLPVHELSAVNGNCLR